MKKFGMGKPTKWVEIYKLKGDDHMSTLAAPTPVNPSGPSRSLRIEVADNGFVVYIEDGGPDYKSTKLVFTGQPAMLRAIKEATTVKRDEEK